MSGTLVTPPDADARSEIGRVIGHAFGFDPAAATGWFDLAGHDNLRAWHAEGEVVGAFVQIPMGMFLGGRSVRNMGYAGVATRVDRLRLGHARGMMAAGLAEARAAGHAVASLYASNQPLYRAVGFEQAGLRCLAEVDPKVLGTVRSDLPVHEMTEADFPAMDEIYQSWATARTGFLDRSDYCWRRLRVPGSRGRPLGLLVGPADAPEGYITWIRGQNASDGFSALNLLDVAATTPRALERILGLLKDLGTLTTTLTLPTHPSGPLWGLPGHPPWATRVQEAWMLRVLDVDAALSGRGYPTAVSGEVHLHVEDDILPENTGPRVLRVEGGSGTVERGGHGRVRITPRGLATVITGFRRPEDASWLGLIDGPAEDLAVLGALMAGPSPWMRDFF